MLRSRKSKAYEENGGAEATKLEPRDFDQILTELEDWSSILASEPEVIHRLAAFAAAAEDASGEVADDPGLDSSFEEPTP